MFSTAFSILTIALAAIALAAGLAVLAIVLPQLGKVRRACCGEAVEPGAADAPAQWPGVSVIVHSRADASALSLLLPQILGQDYPGAMEVIVVNDAGDDTVSAVVAELEPYHRNLYMTFTPPRSRNLSRKKLAITLGIKAARYDVVVLLDGNSRLRTQYWLSTLVAPIAAGRAAVVTGYGYMVCPVKGEGKVLGRLGAFSQMRTAVQYLSAALAGRMYRAFGGNMALRREDFFGIKGFSDSLNLRGGHDDIFVSAISRGKSVAAVLAPCAMVEVIEENQRAIHRLDKLAHDFTARYVSGSRRRLWGFASLLWWAWTGCTVAAIITALPSLIPLIALTVVALGVCIPLMVTWRRTAKALCTRPLALTVPFFFWVHPFYTLIYRIRGRRHRNDNYTWTLQ